MTSVRPTLCNAVHLKHKTFIFKDISKSSGETTTAEKTATTRRRHKETRSTHVFKVWGAPAREESKTPDN